MTGDRLYWGSLALFGLAGTVRGLAAVADGDPQLGAWGTLVGGALVLVAAAAALVRDHELTGGADTPLVRGAAVGGALLFALGTALELL